MLHFVMESIEPWENFEKARGLAQPQGRSPWSWPTLIACE
jgi:hypothetical protein